MIITGLVLSTAVRCAGQDTLSLTDGFPHVEGWAARKTISTALVGVIACTTLLDSYYAWWRGAAKPFTFLGHNEENWLSGVHKGIDKPGHFFGTYVMYKSIRNVLLWGGHDRSTAFWWAAGLGLWNGLEIEIGDGFSPYGFDYQDLVFDVAGVSYGILQSEIPFLENFNVKFSYWSETGFKSPANFTKDYDALTLWLTFNVHRLLPASVDRYWPEFLQLAVGYGVSNFETRRRLSVGLDLNLEAFKTDNTDVLLAEKLLNIVHWPAPAAVFVEGEKPRVNMFFTK